MKHIANLLLVILAVLAPAKSMFVAAGILIAADLILGVMASRKQKIPVTSSGLRRTIIKMFVYETAILLGFICQTYLMHDLVPVASIVSGFVGMTEMVSCVENLNIISGNNLLKALIEKLGSANQTPTDSK